MTYSDPIVGSIDLSTEELPKQMRFYLKTYTILAWFYGGIGVVGFIALLFWNFFCALTAGALCGGISWLCLFSRKKLKARYYKKRAELLKKVDHIKLENEQRQNMLKEELQRFAEKNGYKLTAREMQLMALNAGCTESIALNAAAGFNHIASSVRPNEKVVFCIGTGPIYARLHSLGSSAVVLTESRMIFAGRTSDFIKTVSSFSLDLEKIDAIDMQAQSTRYNLMITASGEQTECTFAALKNEDGARLLNNFINAVYDCKKSKSEKKQQTNIISQVSAVDELKKFKELLDLGIITQEEFDAKKKQLLGL